MFLTREIDIKLFQIYTKIHIYIYIQFCVEVVCYFKQIIFSKYAANLKTKISQNSLVVIQITIFKFFFLFLMDIIDNIIFKSVLSHKNCYQ